MAKPIPPENPTFFALQWVPVRVRVSDGGGGDGPHVQPSAVTKALLWKGLNQQAQASPTETPSDERDVRLASLGQERVVL